jgi:hypothetical protein
MGKLLKEANEFGNFWGGFGGEERRSFLGQ